MAAIRATFKLHCDRRSVGQSVSVRPPFAGSVTLTTRPQRKFLEVISYTGSERLRISHILLGISVYQESRQEG
jgi:hypothetical protein